MPGRRAGIRRGAGAPWVEVPGGGLVPARLTSAVTPDLVRAAQRNGTPVVLGLERGDPSLPILLGVLAAPAGSHSEAQIDGRRIQLTGEEEVTLRCGKASITLTRAGKIILRGSYLLSRSSGVNRIKGGSVQIN